MSFRILRILTTRRIFVLLKITSIVKYSGIYIYVVYIILLPSLNGRTAFIDHGAGSSCISIASFTEI